MLTVLERDASPNLESALPLVSLTNTITTVTSSHFSPPSEKSRLPKSWQRWNGKSLSPAAAPWWATAQFSPFFNLGWGRERGKKQTGRKTCAERRRSTAKEHGVYFQCVSSLPAYVCATRKNLLSWQQDFLCIGVNVWLGRRSTCWICAWNSVCNRSPSGCRWYWCVQHTLTYEEDSLLMCICRFKPCTVLLSCNSGTEASNGPPPSQIYSMISSEMEKTLFFSSLWKGFFWNTEKTLLFKDNHSPSSASLPPPLARLYLFCRVFLCYTVN